MHESRQFTHLISRDRTFYATNPLSKIHIMQQRLPVSLVSGQPRRMTVISIFSQLHSSSDILLATDSVGQSLIDAVRSSHSVMLRLAAENGRGNGDD